MRFMILSTYTTDFEKSWSAAQIVPVKKSVCVFCYSCANTLYFNISIGIASTPFPQCLLIKSVA